MKGGLLLALRYDGVRHTRDIDFSTEDSFASSRLDNFREVLVDQLVVACDRLDYGVDCRVQGVSVSPRSQEASFQTVTARIGYARTGSREHRRLLHGQGPHVVILDYSFNERIHVVEELPLGEHLAICAYSRNDLIAEKLRALLQQVTRDRKRRQDAFDLHWLLTRTRVGDDDRKAILDSLVDKAQSRYVMCGPRSILDPEVERRSHADYAQLAQEIDGLLPEFESVFALVRKFYQSLPWRTLVSRLE